MELSLDDHRERLTSFACSFLGESEKDDYSIQLKIDHTMRVLDNAAVICESTDMDNASKQAALLGALYHDVGRFPQYHRYKTFNDSISVNHALLGVKALISHRFLAGLPPAMKRTVYGAVRMHNMKVIPPNTPPELATVCNIVRDSDKLDIFLVILSHLDLKNPNRTVVMDAKPDPEKFTPALLEELMRGEIADYRKITWTNDFKLLIAGWAFDLNFSKSYAILKSKGYINQIFDSLPKKEVFKKLRHKIEVHVEKQII